MEVGNVLECDGKTCAIGRNNRRKRNETKRNETKRNRILKRQRNFENTSKRKKRKVPAHDSITNLNKLALNRYSPCAHQLPQLYTRVSQIVLLLPLFHIFKVQSTYEVDLRHSF